MKDLSEQGGPAFACRMYDPGPPSGWIQCQGMSLRDWFAGQALAGMAGLQDWTWEDTAWAAYEAADLMLKERLKEK